MDEYTTASVTAKGNTMNIDMTAETEDEEAIKTIKESYGGDDGKEQMEDLAAYFLTSMKPQVRGFGADANVKMTLNGEELNSIKMTYSEAKKHLKEAEEEAEEEAETEADADDAEAETEADADDAAAETEEAD